MASSNINEPFVLATYHSTLRGNSNPCLRTFATVHQRSDKSDEYVTVAAQADGVHILDVANLHPVISHTLGPSTTFSCPPLSLSSSKHSWTTYAVISSSSELTSIDDANRTLWMWSVESSNEKEKKTKPLFSKGKSVHSLHACHELPGRIVALSNTGDVTILNCEDLETISNHTQKSPDTGVLYSWLFPRSVLNLGDSQKGGILVLIVSGATDTTHLRILAIDEADSISQLREQTIGLSSENIISASCNTSGFLSILSKDGVWSLFSLSTTLNQASATLPTENSLRLTGFLFPGSPSCSSSISTLAMTSSHVLLASTLSSQEVALHIWDLRFAVLFASHTFAIPSSLSSTALHLTLLGSEIYQTAPKSQKDCNAQQEFLSGQAYLIISSAPSYSRTLNLKDKQETKLTAVVFAVPYTVSRMSTIAAAMGRGAVSKQWLKNEVRLDPATKDSAAETMKNDLLSSLRHALQDGRVQAAETTFMKWTSSLTGKEADDTASNLTFGYNFVKGLLEIIFLPLSSLQLRKAPLKRSHASEITHYLLERGVISSAMLAPLGGLLSVLRSFDDWEGIEIAFNKVLDLTEMEIVETLKIVLTHHRRCRPPPPKITSTSEVSDTMQVDLEVPPKISQSTPITPSSATPLTLASYLHLVATYPTSRVPLLIAFRLYLQDPEDVTTLVQMLSSWIERRSKMDMDPGVCRKMMPNKKDLKKTKEGVWVVKTRQRENLTMDNKRKSTIPPLEKITNLIQTLLDACFLSLLSYKPSHQILYDLSSQLTPEIAFTHAARGLLGALEPFSIAQEKSVRESTMSKDEKEREKQRIGWRQRKKGFGAAVRADIGIYTLEDLVL